VSLLLGPHPEGADDGGDLGARARVTHRPGVDHLAEVVGRNLERLPVGEEEAHACEDRLVVAYRRLRRAVLVAKPAQVATDELTERRLAVRLVLHRLPDDPGGVAERQACLSAIQSGRGVGEDDRVGPDTVGDCKERELAARIVLHSRVPFWSRHPRRLAWRGRQ
jgi:hypothetical protein